jgi:hypothetical protein
MKWGLLSCVNIEPGIPPQLAQRPLLAIQQ